MAIQINQDQADYRKSIKTCERESGLTGIVPYLLSAGLDSANTCTHVQLVVSAAREGGVALFAVRWLDFHAFFDGAFVLCHACALLDALH